MYPFLRLLSLTKLSSVMSLMCRLTKPFLMCVPIYAYTPRCLLCCVLQDKYHAVCLVIQLDVFSSTIYMSVCLGIHSFKYYVVFLFHRQQRHNSVFNHSPTDEYRWFLFFSYFTMFQALYLSLFYPVGNIFSWDYKLEVEIFI